MSSVTLAWRVDVACKTSDGNLFFEMHLCLRLASTLLNGCWFKGSNPQSRSTEIALLGPEKHRDVQNKG